MKATKDVGHEQAAVPGRGRAARWLLVALNCGMLVVGTTGGPLISRLYFSKGGHRQWLSAWLQTAGWPLLLVPVAASYLSRRARDRRAPLFLTPTRVLLAGVGLGFLNGADDFVYAYGLAYLPVSTSAILISTQLAFTVFFACLIVRQRLTAATLNAVALLTIGAVVLGLHASKDRPAGVTSGKYWMGFFLTLGAAALYGLILPLVELAYKHAAGGGRAVTYALVMEMQLVMGFFATAFCTVGMVVNKDFQLKEAEEMEVLERMAKELQSQVAAEAPDESKEEKRERVHHELQKLWVGFPVVFVVASWATCKDVVHEQAAPGRGRAARWLLVALNCGMLMVGTTGGPLISRLYFSKGGHRQWLSAWLETAGWPLLLVPVSASYLGRRARDRGAPLFLTPRRVLLACVGLGVLTGADDFIYAYGLDYLPLVMGFFATAFCTVGMVVNKDFQLCYPPKLES
uniref:Probable purine permease n=1 Tax=Oryza glumipatula TaxID=40148 RepID=A0A0E0B427_9ORYZ